MHTNRDDQGELLCKVILLVPFHKTDLDYFQFQVGKKGSGLLCERALVRPNRPKCLFDSLDRIKALRYHASNHKQPVIIADRGRRPGNRGSAPSLIVGTLR